MHDLAMPDHRVTPATLVGAEYVCARLGLSRQTLIRRIDAGVEPQPVGKLPGLRGPFIFDRAAVEAIAAKGEGR